MNGEKLHIYLIVHPLIESSEIHDEIARQLINKGISTTFASSKSSEAMAEASRLQQSGCGPIKDAALEARHNGVEKPESEEEYKNRIKEAYAGITESLSSNAVVIVSLGEAREIARINGMSTKMNATEVYPIGLDKVLPKNSIG